MIPAVGHRQAWIQAIDAESFLRCGDGIGLQIPIPTAYVSDPLRLSQLRAGPPQHFLGLLAFGDVHADASQANGLTAPTVRDLPVAHNPAHRPVRPESAIFGFEIAAMAARAMEFGGCPIAVLRVHRIAPGIDRNGHVGCNTEKAAPVGAHG
jgi:hypothetical protein